MVRRLPSQLLPNKKQRIILCSLLLAGGAATAFHLSSRPETDVVAPSYDIILPQRTAIEDLGGWRRTSPADGDPVFAYNDEVDDIGISVSQQPLPASFVGDVAAKVRQLAESENATTAIDAGGTKVYIGVSVKGPQSVYFAKDNTLVLIKSEKAISQVDWISYINNLVNPKTEQTPTF